MRRGNLLRKEEDNDPMSVVGNLFDVAMVFAVALMVALVTRYSMTEIFSQEDFTIVKNPGKENMEIITKEGETVNRYTPSENQDAKEGSRGRRVGIAYDRASDKQDDLCHVVRYHDEIVGSRNGTYEPVPSEDEVRCDKECCSGCEKQVSLDNGRPEHQHSQGGICRHSPRLKVTVYIRDNGGDCSCCQQEREDSH